VEKVDPEALARQLWAIGDIARLRILSELPSEADCEHANNVSQLAEKLGLAQPTVSHHLRVLRQAGLICGKRMCRDVFYWVNEDEANAIVQRLQQVLVEERAGQKNTPES